MLPPNPLTDLLGRSASPLAMYQNLRARGLLSPEGRSRPWDVIDFIVRTLAEVGQDADRARRCGPSDIDYLARELASSHYLHARKIRHP